MNDLYTNIPEEGHEIAHTIYDKLGNAYTVKGCLLPSGIISYVYSDSRCRGRINWDIQESGVMLITDLIIFESFARKPWWARVFPFLYKEPPSYKGRGLGSAMLNYTIESARKLGVSEIRGWITGTDFEATPYLPEFYRKHGFTVRDDLTIYKVLG